DVPARTPESDAFSKDLKRRGFRFVGSTIMYAFMQAVGMVNDHAVDCFRSRLEVQTKADGSPVTRADRDTERVVRAWVERHFPDDGILGEEFGETRPGARRRWLVDPVDGTRA